MATLATNVSFQCLGLDGKPLAGGKVYTYEAGTTTPKSTYTTMAGDVPNSNPVILDQNGKAKIFLGDGAYRMRVLDSNDALIDDIDQISRYVTQSEFASFQQTVQDGVDQLTEVREQIDVFVNSTIGNQKGFANGIAPLDANVKVDPIYLPAIPVQNLPSATTTDVGVTQLNNTLTSTSTTQALTAAQGMLLNSLSFMGKSWKNVTTSRVANTTYINTNPYPIFIAISSYNTSPGYSLYLDDTFQMLGGNAGGSGGSWTISTIVLPGGSYKYTGAVNMQWLELS